MPLFLLCTNVQLQKKLLPPPPPLPDDNIIIHNRHTCQTAQQRPPSSLHSMPLLSNLTKTVMSMISKENVIMASMGVMLMSSEDFAVVQHETRQMMGARGVSVVTIAFNAVVVEFDQGQSSHVMAMISKAGNYIVAWMGDECE